MSDSLYLACMFTGTLILMMVLWAQSWDDLPPP
jgi:hypothetical protein